MGLEEVKNGVHVHTKITKDIKKTIEAMSKETAVSQNIIINALLTRALAGSKATAPAFTTKKKRRA